MTIAEQRGKLIFRKLERDLVRLSSVSEIEHVHSFRTTARRLEILLERLAPEDGRNGRKLLKMLDRIRRRAGKIRDIDVQLAALRSLKVSQEPRRKTQLVQSLLEVRAQHEAKLTKLLKKSHIRELRRRLQRAARAIEYDALRDPLAVAKEILRSVTPPDGPVSEELLHRCRLAVKRARYAAEFSPDSAESRKFISQLQKVQDVLGNWHDWLTLTDTAVEHFGEMNHSSLVAALHNVTRGKFRSAVAAISFWNAGKEVAGSERNGFDLGRKSRPKSAALAKRTDTAA